MMVRDGLVHVAASDAHSVDRRPPSVTGELEDAGLGELAEWLASGVPRAILDGAALPAKPAQPSRPTGLRGLLGR